MKTTEDYDFLEEALKTGFKVHSEVLKRVDLTRQDRPHAIYLLQGSALTNAYASIQFGRQGFLNAVFQVTRFVKETIELMDYIASLEDRDRHISAWFRDEVISVPRSQNDRRTEEQIEKLSGLFNIPVESVTRYKEGQKVMWEEFSKSTHPTLGAVRYNMTTTGHVDYTSGALANDAMQDFTIGSFVVIPVLGSLLLHAKIVPYTRAEFDLVRPLVDEVEKSSSLPAKGND